jgi:hypothetical protein
MTYKKPPYQISNRILELIVSISEKIGEINAAYLYKPPTELRKKNRIKTIQSYLKLKAILFPLTRLLQFFKTKELLVLKKIFLRYKMLLKFTKICPLLNLQVLLPSAGLMQY